MTARHVEPELVLAPTASFGEGPLWDDRTGLLWWTDIPGSVVHRFDPRTGEDVSIPVPTTVGAIVPRASGGFVVAASDGFAAMNEQGELDLLAPVTAADPGLRMNDGKCDAAGRFYASTMTYDGEQPVGELVRLDPDLTTHPQADGLRIGNGLAFSADQRTLWFTDTMAGGVDAFDVDPATGDLRNRRRAFDIDTALGLPDGFCIDDEGALWVAMWKGGAVRRYSPQGELLAVVELPVTNVTCAAFGGRQLDELYITTAAPSFAGLDREEPLGGALFRVRPGVSGPAPDAFRG